MGKKKKLFLFILPLTLVSLASCYVDQTPSDDTTIPDGGTDETPDDTTPDNPDEGTDENPDNPDETPDDPEENPDENPDNPDGDITEPEEEPLEIHSYEDLIEYVEDNYSDLNNQNYSIDGGLEIYYYQDSSLDTLLYSDIGVNTSVECTDDFIWYSRKMTESYYQCDDTGMCNRADESFIFKKDDGMICYDYTFVCDNVDCVYGTQNSHICGYYSYPETYDATNLYEFYRYNDFAFSLYAFTTKGNSVYTLSNYKDNVETVEDSEGNTSWIIRNDDLFEMMRAVGGGDSWGHTGNTNTYFLIKVNEDNQLEFNGFTTVGSVVYKYYLKINNQATETTDSLAEFLNDFTWTSTLASNSLTNSGSGVDKVYYTRQDENDTWNVLRTTSAAIVSLNNLEIGTQLGFEYTRDGYKFDAENSFLNNYNYEGIKYDETSGYYYVDITQHQTYIYAAWIEE